MQPQATPKILLVVSPLGADRFHECQANTPRVVACGHLGITCAICFITLRLALYAIPRKLLTLPAVMFVLRLFDAPRNKLRRYRSLKSDNDHLHGYRNVYQFWQFFEINSYGRL